MDALTAAIAAYVVAAASSAGLLLWLAHKDGAPVRVAAFPIVTGVAFWPIFLPVCLLFRTDAKR